MGLWASYLADLSTTGPLFHPDFHFAFEIRGGPRAINPVFRFLESCLKMSFFERERERERELGEEKKNLFWERGTINLDWRIFWIVSRKGDRFYFANFCF